jgi:hypothetical protein
MDFLEAEEWAIASPGGKSWIFMKSVFFPKNHRCQRM